MLTRDELLLTPIGTRLGIPRAAMFRLRPRSAAGNVEVHVVGVAFWRAVARHHLVVTTNELPPQDAFPFEHRFIHDGVEFFTLSASRRRRTPRPQR